MCSFPECINPATIIQIFGNEHPYTEMFDDFSHPQNQMYLPYTNTIYNTCIYTIYKSARLHGMHLTLYC